MRSLSRDRGSVPLLDPVRCGPDVALRPHEAIRCILMPLPRLRRAFVVGLIVVALGAPSWGKARVKATTKTPASHPTASQPSTLNERIVVRSTRNAGTPISGWAKVSAVEWPSLASAPVVHSNGKSVFVFRDPGATTGILRFDPTQTEARDRAFLALGEQNGFYKVLLPIRPNGTIGWVKASDVSLDVSALRVVIELATNTLTLFRDGKAIMHAPVASGSGSTPTPQGLFFIVDRIPQARPDGALGPIVLKLSGFSETLNSFAGGQGSIGLHGTSAPGLIGQRVSHGCVRMSNATIVALASLAPIGTPVEIIAKMEDRPRRALDVASLLRPRVQAASVTTLDATSPDRRPTVTLSNPPVEPPIDPPPADAAT